MLILSLTLQADCGTQLRPAVDDVMGERANKFVPFRSQHTSEVLHRYDFHILVCGSSYLIYLPSQVIVLQLLLLFPFPLSLPFSPFLMSFLASDQKVILPYKSLVSCCVNGCACISMFPPVSPVISLESPSDPEVCGIQVGD